MNSKMTDEISSLFDRFRKTMGAPIWMLKLRMNNYVLIWI